jgi:plastocyanin
LVLFAAAIFHGHQLSVLDRAASSGGFSLPATQSPVAEPSVAPSTVATAVSSPATTQPGISSVTMRMMKYLPATLEVARGETVEWKNDDLTPHTATSMAKQFDSGPINPGASWRHTFTEEGDFAYLCTFHPEMKGVIMVR